MVTVLSDAVYRIQREGSRQRKIVHFDRLKPYYGATQSDQRTHDQVHPQPMETENELDEWEIIPYTVEAEPEESVTEAAESRPDSAVPPLRRSQRSHRPPQRYGIDDIYV